MNTAVLTKTYSAPRLCEKEILRYAGSHSADNETQNLLNTCLDIAKDKFVYKVCYCQLPVNISEDICDFGIFEVKSLKLAQNLNGCHGVIVFGATVGVEIDRLIAKYSRISPAKALMLQGMGAERIEALCDRFCEDIKSSLKTNLKPRFSAGYGDLPLDTQKQIFNLLNLPKHIGLSLNDSLIMSPSKSVTAFVGLTGETEKTVTNKCDLCDNKDCTFRGAL